jgi:hypothetical protein
MFDARLYISSSLGASSFVIFFAATVAAAAIDFDRDVRPILSDKCVHCHGPDGKKRKAGLRLDTREGAIAKHKDGWQAIVPGDLKASHAWQRILTDDPDELMPPPDSNRTLSAKEKATLRQWILAGAEWSEHWAFTRINRPAVPQTGNESPIDAFVAAKLKSKGLHMAVPATKHDLIRRATLDLTGLPPTIEELDAFLSDNKAGAYERAIDRLLASPHYGERMAWPWLDAARYADSNGYQHDAERTMWPWRDWVVDAFNRNVPFDDFTVWQIAGDLLPNPTHEQKLATGFLRNHMINGEGGRIPEENRVEYAFDQLETVGTNWLALTFNCNRCHDHKYDPLTQKDYYAFFAFFNQTPINGGGRSPQQAPNLEVPTDEQKRQLKELEAQRKRILDTRKKREQALAAEFADQTPAASWQPLKPGKATAVTQQLKIEADGTIFATGPNPNNDDYVVEIPLTKGRSLHSILLRARPHKSMTKGGLARSNSGNFVLTDFRISLIDPSGTKALPIKSAKASFEQGALKVTNAFDNNPKSGWAVWNGKPITNEHRAAFVLTEAITAPENATLRVELKHQSKHAHHNLGYFQLQASADANTPLNEKTPDAKPDFSKDGKWQAHAKQLKSVDDKIKNLRKAIPKVMIMADTENRETFVLDHGAYNQRRDKVTAAVPAALPSLPDGAKPNRLALARWLVDRENPLTARVIVNRFWAEFFGIGLVKTTENFGTQGERPEYRELLDWLAADFIESGWNVKRLVRQIVTSETYRQSSAAEARMIADDPENRLLARGPRYRLPSWMIRDQALAASGLFVNKPGGPGVMPYQPAGVWAEMTFGGGKKHYKRDSGDKLYRRSLYTFWRRIVGPTMFFDAAKRQVCEVNALRTNTPLHALATLNDETYVEAGRAMAQRVLQTEADDDARLEMAFRLATARAPNDKEKKLLHRSITRLRDEYRSAPELASAYLEVGQHRLPADIAPGEAAAWSSLCLTILNLDETLSKE